MALICEVPSRLESLNHIILGMISFTQTRCAKTVSQLLSAPSPAQHLPVNCRRGRRLELRARMSCHREMNSFTEFPICAALPSTVQETENG
jgi:hypothetical protein